MADDPQKNWNNLIQKLTIKTMAQGPDSSADFITSNLNLLQQKNNGAKPDNEFGSNDGEEKLSNIAASIIHNVDDIPDLQITNIKNYAHESKTGRTIALNSRFICYPLENDVLAVKSLRNLSLVHIVEDNHSRIADMAFLDDSLTNYLALLRVNGSFGVYDIDLDPAKEKIVIKEVIKHDLGYPYEKGQLQWKDARTFGVVKEKYLTVFKIHKEENDEHSYSHRTYHFETNITDFAFSPGYPLVYVLLQNNVVQILHSETGDRINQFKPHDDTSAPVLKILAYKSLFKHDFARKEAGDAKLSDEPPRDIFITATEGFEIKVWDLSEWDPENKTYYCIDSFELTQNNNNLDTIPLIKRYIFFDSGLNFVFVGFKTNDDRGIIISALHIDQFYWGFSDNYDTLKKSKKFFNYGQALCLKKNDLTDLSVLNFGEDEIEYYFKKNTYHQMNDFEPASTRTQDGSYGFNSKSVLIFFVHNEDTISISKVSGEKLYPCAEVEESDKMTQAEQFDSQSTVSKSETTESTFPPEIPSFVKELLENKKLEAKVEEEKLIKTSAEPEEVKAVQKAPTKKEEAVEPNKKNAKDNQGTKSPEFSKAFKKNKGKNKDAGNDQNEPAGKQKGGQPKAPKADKNISPQLQQAVNKKSNEVSERETPLRIEEDQVQAIEAGIEKRFQEFTDKSLQVLDKNFSKIEDVIEKKVTEKLAKLQMEALNNVIPKKIDERMQKEFANSFERTVTPCFEKYLGKMFEQVCTSFEKGHKFYIDRLAIEQANSAQLKETMNEVITNFIKISGALTQGFMNNQNGFNKLDITVQDKQNQISRLIDQMNEILERQQYIYKRVENLEKNMQNTVNRFRGEAEAIAETANKNFQRFGQPPLPGFYSGPNAGAGTKVQGEGKREPQSPGSYSGQSFGMYPQGQTGQYYNKSSKEPLNDSYAYLESIAAGRPMDVSGGLMSKNQNAYLPGVTPGGSMFNPAFYQQQQLEFYNALQQQKNNTKNNFYGAGMPNLPQQSSQNPSLANPQMGANLQSPFYNQSPQMVQQTQLSMLSNQMSPELQAMYLNQFIAQSAKEKEEQKPPEFTPNTGSVQDNQSYFLNLLAQDNMKKFFEPNTMPQVQGSSNQQTPGHRNLAQIENQQQQQQQITKSPNTTVQAPNYQQQDQESLDKNVGQLPPGMQTQGQPQSNIVQDLLQTFPQNIQMNLTQPQNLTQQKAPANFASNLDQTNGGVQNADQQANNQMGQNRVFSFLQGMFPHQTQAQGGYLPQNVNQGYSNFGGYTGQLTQMMNPQIKTGAMKNTNAVDISQIPLVNSTFKLPNRESASSEENRSVSGNTRNNTV